mgnify:CR=1 FL=1|tara:strand:+ start:431 stop:655 length:225 start_codon:yes stop_codon:yes gene_type:complete
MDSTINTSHATISFLHLDKVVPEWPELKKERVEKTKELLKEKSEVFKHETIYAYHPHNQNKFTTEGQIVDFVVA